VDDQKIGVADDRLARCGCCGRGTVVATFDITETTGYEYDVLLCERCLSHGIHRIVRLDYA